MNNILEVQRLRKSYGSFTLNDVSFALPRGMKVKLQIATALSHNAKLLIYDTDINTHIQSTRLTNRTSAAILSSLFGAVVVQR